jgi:hypothetical protein
MGKVHFGAQGKKDKAMPQLPKVSEVSPVIITQEPIIQIQERIVEVPVERIVTIEKPIETIVERIVEVPVEKIVEVPVERIVEKTVYIDRPVEVVREFRVHDVEKLLLERERVRLLKRSNAILRVAIITMFVVGLTAIGVLLG